MNAKELIDQVVEGADPFGFVNAVSGNKNTTFFRAIFINDSTKQLFASEPYNSQLDYFIKDTLSQSHGKLRLVTKISEKEFAKKYHLVKEVPQIALTMIVEK